MKYLGHEGTVKRKEFDCAVYCWLSLRWLECFIECPLICSEGEKNIKFVSINVIISWARERHTVAPGSKVAPAFYQMEIKQWISGCCSQTVSWVSDLLASPQVFFLKALKTPLWNLTANDESERPWAVGWKAGPKLQRGVYVERARAACGY